MILPKSSPHDDGLGAQFRARRTARKLSRRELALAAEVNPDTIADLEGSGRGQIGAAGRICNALGARWRGCPDGLEVADWLRGLRRSKRLSQQQVAGLADISVLTVGGFEAGRGNLTSLRAILSVFDLPLRLFAPEAGVLVCGDQWELVQADARDQLAQYARDGRRFHGVMCDPPYGIGAAAWDGEIAMDETFWRSARAVLFPGSYLLAFAAPNRSHRVATALERAGFVIRDRIVWLRSGVPWGAQNLSAQIDAHLGHERRIVSEDQQRIGRTSSAGASEALYGKQRSYSGLRRSRDAISPEAAAWAGYSNRLKDAIEDIIVAQVPFAGSLAKNVLQYGVGALNIDGLRIEGRVAARREPASGSYWRPHQGGRWPSNVVLGEGFQDEPYAGYFHCAKPIGADRWGHPTSKPVRLLRGLLRLVSPPGSTVLDLFAGAASCGEAALREGLVYTGIEIDHRHLASGRRRLTQIGEP